MVQTIVTCKFIIGVYTYFTMLIFLKVLVPIRILHYKYGFESINDLQDKHYAFNTMFENNYNTVVSKFSIENSRYFLAICGF